MKTLRNKKIGVGLYSDKSIESPATFTYKEYDFDFDQARKAAFKFEKKAIRKARNIGSLDFLFISDK